MSQPSCSMQIDTENDENIFSQQENLVCFPLKRRRNESPIWKYCLRLEDGSKKCNVEFCSKIFDKSTSNTTIMGHLKDAHSIDCQAKTSNDNETQIRNKAVHKHGVEEQTKRTKALLDFIIESFQAFSIVNTRSFLNFCYLMDPRFVVPERHSISNLIDREFESSLNQLKIVIMNFLT